MGLLIIACVSLVFILIIWANVRAKQARYSYTEGEGRHNYPHVKYGYRLPGYRHTGHGWYYNEDTNSFMVIGED